ncbi:MAG: hypothetical protein J6U60_01475 [Clostridia bacterium]|nr:hypothetical protein [Clostridia bacterium]
MQNETRKKRTWQKRLLVILCAVLFFVGAVLGVLGLGVVYTEKNWDYWSPNYEKIDILPLLQKDERTEEDYRILYEQTGLTKIGIDGLLAEDKMERILKIQAYFFSKPALDVVHFAPFTYLEEVDGVAPLALLEDGDILVSATTRVSWWRYGHSALVVDGDDGVILEALEPGSKSRCSQASTMANLSNFMILRPKLDKSLRKEVAEYALENLRGVPYRLTVGVLSKKYNPDTIKGTQCAHLVWYAYKKFGVDLDSNGGGIVKPQDMALSAQVEVVQAFGFDLDKLWS